MRTATSTDYDRDKDIEKFSGDEPDAAMKFLEHDINGQDNAEAKYGVIGVAIHRGTDPVITAANLDAEATKLHRFINIAEGSKAGDAAWNNDDFWTPAYQNAYRLHWKRQLLQWQKHHSTGRYRAWLQDFKAEDYSRIRDLAMREFGNVNQGVIAAIGVLLYHERYRYYLLAVPGQARDECAVRLCRCQSASAQE